MGPPEGTPCIAGGERPHRLYLTRAGLAECECGHYSIEYPTPISEQDAIALIDSHRRHAKGEPGYLRQAATVPSFTSTTAEGDSP